MNFRIYADKMSFASIEEAARAEEKINWLSSEGPEHEACTTCFAALELAEMLNKVSGIDATLCDYGTECADSIAIFLATPSQVLPLEKFFGAIDFPKYEQSFIIKTAKNKKAYLIAGAERTGVLYGAYELLNILGFRWFSPDKCDEDIPASISELPVINNFFTPSFLTRGFFSPEDRGGDDFLLWMARNKMNQWTISSKKSAFCRKLGMKLMGGSHDLFDKYLSPKKYFSKSPEWYGLVNGKRSDNIRGNIGDNICISNREACEFFAGKLLNDLIDGEFKGADFINIWPLDNGKYCECENCRKLGNSSSHIMMLAYYCRNAIKKAYDGGCLIRDTKLVVPAYHETLEPPSMSLPADFDYGSIIVSFFPIERCFAHYFDDPLCEEINKDMLSYWKKWTEDKKRPWNMLMGEYYNVSAFAAIAVPLHKIMSHDIPYYHKTGTRHMHYMHVTTAQWGTLALTNSLFAALMWNASLDNGAYTKDFFEKRYRKSSGLMADFYSILQDAMSNCKALKHYAGMQRHSLYFNGLNQKQAHLFQTQHFTYEQTVTGKNGAPSVVETVSLLSEAEKIVDQVLLECKDPQVAERLVLDARRFRYTRDIVHFLYRFIRVRLFENKGAHERARLEALALRDIGETLRNECEMTKYIRGFDFRHPELYVNGLSATWLPKAYAELMADYGLETPDTPDGKLKTKETDKAFA
ncbi:MAG: hypothetical protein A2017_00955 [Lentisphaerae bacterium GWF2_44_16]|nr:MAG: hypothetical protein A2017_00955 [Lentisphaerae bacterium GWF2_44_16]